MPLLYQDGRPTHAPGLRLPEFLAPWAGELQRAESAGGDIVGLWDPLLFSPTDLPAGTAWHEIGDGWRAALVGDPVPAAWLSKAADRPQLLPIDDGFGRAWHAPAILSPRDVIALPMPLRLDADQHWSRVPSPAQARLIAAARSARAEWLTPVEGASPAEVMPRMVTVPIQVCAVWAATLLGAIYPLNPPALSALGLLSDVLVRNVLLASSGCTKA
jgi:hypothetical protein